MNELTPIQQIIAGLTGVAVLTSIAVIGLIMAFSQMV